MTVTSSTGFAASRPETPNLTERIYPDDSAPAVRIQESNGSEGLDQSTAYAGVEADCVQSNDIINEKSTAS